MRLFFLGKPLPRLKTREELMAEILAEHDEIGRKVAIRVWLGG
jgi:hypothetical protein